MIFESTHVAGKGRGRPMGFPTINLKVPDNFELKDGVYAANVIIENKKFVGALHFGPIPTFSEDTKTLEVYLIGLTNDTATNYGWDNLGERIIKVEIIKYLRPVMKFKRVEDLVKQIGEDVANIKSLSI